MASRSRTPPFLDMPLKLLFKNEKGHLSSGIERLLFVIITLLTITFAAGQLPDSPSWIQVIHSLVTLFFKVMFIIFLIFFIFTLGSHLHLAYLYFFCHPFKEKGGSLYISIGVNLKKHWLIKFWKTKL